MNRYRTISTAALALVYLGVAFSASAQSFKEQVVGTWTLTAGMEKLPDGKTVTPWAAGNLTLTASGHMAFFVFAKDRPKGDGNPRTPVGPMVAYYGTYTVDEAKKSLTYNIEVASAPAFDKAAGAVRSVVGIEDGVVSGCRNPTNPGVSRPVETAP
jgi:Lipocalin-like domain